MAGGYKWTLEPVFLMVSPSWGPTPPAWVGGGKHSGAGARGVPNTARPPGYIRGELCGEEDRCAWGVHRETRLPRRAKACPTHVDQATF